MLKKIKFFLILCMILIPAFLMAQGPDPFPDDTDDVPFDGGISLLIIAGIGYGLKKANNAKKNEGKDNINEYLL